MNIVNLRDKSAYGSRLISITTALVVLSSTITAALADSALLSDCSTACSTPSNSECTTACNNNGCPGNWTWVSPANNTIQRCSYTSSFPPGNHGAFLPHNMNNQVVCDTCASAGETDCSGTESTSVSDSDTLTVTGTYSKSVQTAINLGLKNVLTIGVQATDQFTIGESITSTKTVTSVAGSSTTKHLQGCSKVQLYGESFKADVSASGTITFKYEGICSGCNNNWVSVKSCPKTVSLAGSATAFKWTWCDRACGGVPNEACSASVTGETVDNGQCKYYEYP